MQENWIDLFQTAAIIGGFVAIHRDKRKQQVENLLHFTQQHRELWHLHDADPALWRVKRTDVDLIAAPLTRHEENFICDVINHLRSTFFASELGVYIQPSALPHDIRIFFNLPIPKIVWTRAREFHDEDFVAFVESHFEQRL